MERKFKSKRSAPQHEAKDQGGGGGGEGGGIRKGSSVLPSNGGDGCCQVESCGADLRNAKQYHRRHRVCENHSKAQVVLISGIQQRFCQQCSRFHVTSEFDDLKRSCRKKLAWHNERRRKHPTEPTAIEASSRRRVVACGQVNIQENDTYNKHFQINKVATAPSLLS